MNIIIKITNYPAIAVKWRVSIKSYTLIEESVYEVWSWTSDYYDPGQALKIVGVSDQHDLPMELTVTWYTKEYVPTEMTFTLIPVDNGEYIIDIGAQTLSGTPEPDQESPGIFSNKYIVAGSIAAITAGLLLMARK